MSFAHHAFGHCAAAASLARRYRDADLDQRIAAATPHELVAMLYEGARTALLAAEAATTAADAAARVTSTTRALRIFDALDATLDHARGFAVARALSAAYSQVRAITVAASCERRAELFASAASQIAELAQSWAAIAPGAARRSAA